MNEISELETLKANGDAPAWLLDPGFKTLQGGYLLPSETPKGMYIRVATAAASYQKDPAYWKDKFFDVLWKGWLCPATPILVNMGTNRGLPISCNSLSVPDSISGIFEKSHELAMLSKNGAGVGLYFGDIRGRGAKIKGNGVSEGIVPWAKVMDTTIASVSQGSSRRGAAVIYLPIDHPDAEEFINIRRPNGDLNRQCLNMNHAVCISDEWMKSMLAGDMHKRERWWSVLKARVETGEPYLFFTDNVNSANPDCYKDKGLAVKTSNLCNEIFLHTDDDHTFVCCLSSLNLSLFSEWENTDLAQVATRFLDAVISEYIIKSDGVKGLECARRSAIKGRAIGIGVLGWHTLLQERSIPFDSFDAMALNAKVFKTIRSGFEEETKNLALELGEPEWCQGHNRRNTHGLAIAPTVSNSTIAGGHSAGIEPLPANAWTQKSAKGTFFRQNPTLVKVLDEKAKNTLDIWKSIAENDGSVQHLKCLSSHEKEVFRTAREINQFAIVRQAAQRQKWIDQGQSVNLFFASNALNKYIHRVHVEAWRSGMKGLYYFRSEGVLKGEAASRSKDECVACEG